MPAICGGRLVLFGRLLYDEGRFAEAREAFVTAHEAVEAFRGEMGHVERGHQPIEWHDGPLYNEKQRVTSRNM